MHPNQALITRFYEAFAARDHATMATCYADNAEFGDPVFPRLVGPEVAGMWRMLCMRAKDFELTFSGVSADDRSGTAHWEARYTFTGTGRKVHNIINASFELADGKIVKHTDVFDFYRWSRMALGPMGLMLGWSGLVQNKVRRQAGENLKKHMEKEGSV